MRLMTQKMKQENGNIITIAPVCNYETGMGDAKFDGKIVDPSRREGHQK